jgi:hypothetical protein
VVVLSVGGCREDEEEEEEVRREAARPWREEDADAEEEWEIRRAERLASPGRWARRPREVLSCFSWSWSWSWTLTGRRGARASSMVLALARGMAIGS